MRAAALEPSEGATADSAAEVQNLQTIAEPVKTQPAKRYAAIPFVARTGRLHSRLGDLLTDCLVSQCFEGRRFE